MASPALSASSSSSSLSKSAQAQSVQKPNARSEFKFQSKKTHLMQRRMSAPVIDMTPAKTSDSESENESSDKPSPLPLRAGSRALCRRHSCQLFDRPWPPQAAAAVRRRQARTAPQMMPDGSVTDYVDRSFVRPSGGADGAPHVSSESPALFVERAAPNLQALSTKFGNPEKPEDSAPSGISSLLMRRRSTRLLAVDFQTAP